MHDKHYKKPFLYLPSNTPSEEIKRLLVAIMAKEREEVLESDLVN